MAIDWDAFARKAAGLAAAAGKRVAERGLDGLLEDADELLMEGRRRVKKARSRIPKRKPGTEEEEPAADGKTVIDATIDEDK